MKLFYTIIVFSFLFLGSCSREMNMFADVPETKFNQVPDEWANTPFVSPGHSFEYTYVMYTPLNFYAVNVEKRRVFVSDKEIVNFTDSKTMYKFLEARSAGDVMIYLRRQKEAREGTKRHPLTKI